MKHEFPKWFFHQDLLPDGKIVRSQEELDELGEGWVHSPAEFAHTEACEILDAESLEAKEKLDAISEIVEPDAPKKRPRKPKASA